MATPPPGRYRVPGTAVPTTWTTRTNQSYPPDKQKARNKAAAARRAWKRVSSRYPRIELLGVAVEPIWPDLRFDIED